jgi:hypothetical protein
MPREAEIPGVEWWACSDQLGRLLLRPFPELQGDDQSLHGGHYPASLATGTRLVSGDSSITTTSEGGGDHLDDDDEARQPNVVVGDASSAQDRRGPRDAGARAPDRVDPRRGGLAVAYNSRRPRAPAAEARPTSELCGHARFGQRPTGERAAACWGRCWESVRAGPRSGSTSQTLGGRAQRSHPGGRRFESG